MYPSAGDDRRSCGILDGRSGRADAPDRRAGPSGRRAVSRDRRARRLDQSGPVEAAGAVDAQSRAHSSLENHRAGFPQLPQGIIIVMTEDENRKR